MMNVGLEVRRGVVHLLRDRAGPQHLAERVDGPVVDHDPAVRIDLAHLLELAAAHLADLMAALTGDLLTGGRTAGSPALISACRVQSSRTSSGRSTTTPCLRHAARRIASSSGSAAGRVPPSGRDER